eukprot:14675-Heterococcus_DN1.PRE.9
MAVVELIANGSSSCMACAVWHLECIMSCASSGAYSRDSAHKLLALPHGILHELQCAVRSDTTAAASASAGDAAESVLTAHTTSNAYELLTAVRHSLEMQRSGKCSCILRLYIGYRANAALVRAVVAAVENALECMLVLYAAAAMQVAVQQSCMQ